MLKHLSKSFKPLFDRVLVERAAVATRSAGGILLPSSNSPSNEGVVIAVGHDTKPEDIKVGDTVVLPQFGGIELKFEDKTATLYRFNEILGIVSKN